MNDMGTTEPIFSSSASGSSPNHHSSHHNHHQAPKIKSTSIETGEGLAGSAINLTGGQDDSEGSSMESSSENNDQQPNHQHYNHQSKQHRSQQQQQRINQRQATIIGNPLISSKNAKKLLTLSPNSGPMLKPSASISCLPTAVSASDSNDPTSDSTSALVSSLPTRASLTHEWKKLKTPNKCRECNLLVYFNGRECSFCGFIAHKKCVTVLVIKCSGQQVVASKNRKQSHCQCSSHIAKSHKTTKPNSSQMVRPLFGQPIGQLDCHQVIDFIRRFIYEIDTRGLTSKGIYRVSSIKSKVDRLCNYYDQNLSSLVDLSSFHPIIIANALKMYLRQLPEPLMTQELYDSFIQIAKKYPNTASKQSSSTTTTGSSREQKQQASSPQSNNHKQSTSPPKYRRPYSVSLMSSESNAVNNDPSYNPMLIVELTEVMELLPPINREVVGIIMRHLKRVASMSQENQMSSTNLSIIFGPTLLTNANNKSLAIVDNIHQARVVELMITWADQMFPQYENYESKTVIELNHLTENQAEVCRVGQDKSDINNNQQQHLMGRIKQAKLKDGRRVKNDNNNNNNIKTINNNNNSKQETKVDDSTSKTRKDLGELRKQFFTVPAVHTNLVIADICSGLSSPKAFQVESQTKSNKADDDSPGSVPVIKVQPFFCDNLSKYPEKKS